MASLDQELALVFTDLVEIAITDGDKPAFCLEEKDIQRLVQKLSGGEAFPNPCQLGRLVRRLQMSIQYGR
jgi:hypothetical protein